MQAVKNKNKKAKGKEQQEEASWWGREADDRGPRFNNSAIVADQVAAVE